MLRVELSPSLIAISLLHLCSRRYDMARVLITRPDIEVDVLDGRERTPLIMSVQGRKKEEKEVESNGEQP